MTSIMLQVKHNGIIISRVKATNTSAVANATRFFDFPEDFVIDQLFDRIKDFVRFVESAIKIAGYTEKKIVMVLDDDICLQKDFNHPKTNTKNLLMLARLEAESVLQGTATEYSISCHQYGERTNLEGEYRSSLYAIKTVAIKKFRAEFALMHHDLIRIVPRMNCFIYAVSELLNSPKQKSKYVDKCFAVITLNVQNVRVLVFDKATPIYSHTYESAFDDIIKTICEQTSCPQDKAIEYLRGFDFEKPAENELSGKIMILFNMMMENIIRSVHFSAASERLDVSDIIFTGSFANYKGVIESVSRSYEVETTYIETAFPHSISVLKDTSNDMIESMDRLSTSGAYKTQANLLWGLIEKKRRRLSTMGVCVIMSILVIATMFLQPAAIIVSQKLTKDAQKALYDEKFTEVRNLLSQNKDLDDRLVLLEKDVLLYPYGLSNSNKYIADMMTLFTGSTVTAYSFDNSTGIINVTFTVPTYTDFIPINERVVKSDKFSLAVPFTAAPLETFVLYTVGLSVKDFKGF